MAATQLLVPTVLFINTRALHWSALTNLLADTNGFELVTVHSDVEALQQVRHQDFALILLTVEMNDFEAVKALRSHPRSATTPLMLISAHDIDERDRIKAYQAGAVDFLCFPLQPEVLQAKLTVFVELARKNLHVQSHADALVMSNRELEAQRRLDLESINERKQAEEALRRSQEELRQLASHHDRIKEDERKRIAREIHDELGQNLLALRIDVSMLHARTCSTHPKLNGKVRAVLDHIDATMKAMRSIINNLRPTVLDLGLTAAIEWQVKEFERRAGIACELRVQDDELALDDTYATALFRILQESLNNVMRHAQATRAEIELRRDGGILSMRITDNGIGLYPGCRRKANSFGLIGIKERISALGGTLIIDSGKDSGTTLTVSIPIERETADVQQHGHQPFDALAEGNVLGTNTEPIPESAAEHPGVVEFASNAHHVAIDGGISSG